MSLAPVEEVKDFLEDYKSLLARSENRGSSSVAEVNNFYSSALVNNHETQNSIFRALLVSLQDQETRNLFTSNSFSELLFNLYRISSNSNDFKRIAFQYLPSLIGLYFITEKKDVRGLESLFLAIYNNELGESSSTTIAINASFRIPLLTQNSIYHDGSRMEATDLERCNNNNHNLETTAAAAAAAVSAASGASQHVTRLNAQNKQKVFCSLFRSFNSHMGDYPSFVLDNFCQTWLRLLQRGYPKKVAGGCSVMAHPVNRIIVSSGVLLEILHGAYFCAYNGFQRLGSQLVECVRQRGTSDASASVILASNAAKSLMMQQSGKVVPVDTPTFSQVAKNMITNASFRAKKMGDDIPVVEKEDSSTTTTVQISTAATTATASNNKEAKNLCSITEEDNNRNNSNEEAQVDRTSKRLGNQDIKEKLISKLPAGLRKLGDKTDRVSELENKVAAAGGSSSSMAPISSLPSPIINTSLATTMVAAHSGLKAEKKDKLDLKLMRSKKQCINNGGENSTMEIESIEQVEELIKMKNLPSETIIIHSPESGTTLF